MKKNVKIAKQLLKITKELVADKNIKSAVQEKNYDVQKQIAILKTYPKSTDGDIAVHDYIKNAFGVLLARKNGTFQGFEMFQEQCRSDVASILAKANQNIAKDGKLGLTPGEIEMLRVKLGFLSNEEFLVTITPGKIDGKNILQSGPGEENEGAKDEANRWKIKTVPGPGIDKKTQTVALNAPPQRLSANNNWLLNIPQGIINMNSSVKEMVVSWGNRIISGTEVGTTNNPKELATLKTSWTEITDDTINDLEVRVFTKISKLPQHAFEDFIKIFKRLADQMGVSISEQSKEEFDQKQFDVILAIEGFNKKIDGYATTYRQGISNVMSEYNALVAQVEAQGGIVDAKGNITMPENGNITASARRRNAGFFDFLKNIGNKIVGVISSLCDKLTSFKNDTKTEMKNVSDKVIEWSVAGQEAKQAFENDWEAINNCITELNAFVNEQ